MPSPTEDLFRRAAGKLLDVFATGDDEGERDNEAVCLVGAGPGGEDIYLPAIVAPLAIRREFTPKGPHEERRNAEMTEVDLCQRIDVPLSTPVVVRQYGDRKWTIDEIEVDDNNTTMRLYRDKRTQNQRAGREHRRG